MAAGGAATAGAPSAAAAASAQLAQVQAAAAAYLHSLNPDAALSPQGFAPAPSAATAAYPSHSGHAGAAGDSALGLGDLADEDEVAFASFRRSLGAGASNTIDLSALNAPPSVPAAHSSATPSKLAGTAARAADSYAPLSGRTPSSSRPNSSASPRVSSSKKKKKSLSSSMSAAVLPSTTGDSSTPRTFRRNPFLMDKPTTTGSTAGLVRSGSAVRAGSLKKSTKPARAANTPTSSLIGAANALGRTRAELHQSATPVQQPYTAAAAEEYNAFAPTPAFASNNDDGELTQQQLLAEEQSQGPPPRPTPWERRTVTPDDIVLTAHKIAVQEWQPAQPQPSSAFAAEPADPHASGSLSRSDFATVGHSAIPFSLQSPMPRLTSHPLYRAPPPVPHSEREHPAPIPPQAPDPHVGQFVPMQSFSQQQQQQQPQHASLKLEHVRLPREKQEEVSF